MSSPSALPPLALAALSFALPALVPAEVSAEDPALVYAQALPQEPAPEEEPAPDDAPDVTDETADGDGAGRPRGYTQLQLDLFDVSSPGFGFWLTHTRMDREGRPDWQFFVAGGTFDHYAPGELAEHGWGNAEDQRVYGRFGAHWYPWRGLFIGGQVEIMWRRLARHGADEVQWSFMPTLQPTVGWNIQPWGWDHGHASFMVWLAPRFPLLRPELTWSDGSPIERLGVVEFASGANVSLTL